MAFRRRRTFRGSRYGRRRGSVGRKNRRLNYYRVSRGGIRL